MVFFNKKESSLGKGDYCIFFFLACCTFLLFTQSDVIITGNHALLMLEGNPLNFYTRCHDFLGEYGANYLPSTFIVYAIWNIPIKLLGAVAHSVRETPVWQIFWYKLLPCIVYIICGKLVYQLCGELNFDKKKSRFVTYAFLTAPLAFFSQFVIFQYDIFTVFFMLLGLRFYFSEKTTFKELCLFSLCFGMAFTFKYQAVLFFLVLLFLKVKDIPQIIGYSLISGILSVVEFLFYYIFDRESFLHSVVGFSALEFAADRGIVVGFSSINLMVLCACLILAWSYFTYSDNRRDFICDAFFFCSGICVVLFGLMAWHAQWLLLGVFFWTVSACISKYCDTFLWIDMLEITVFYILTVMQYPGGVDQIMLVYGVFHRWLYQKEVALAVSMRDIFHVRDMDNSIFYSIFLAILLVQFIFAHRKFCQEELGQSTGSSWLLRLRLWCGVLLFAIPALLCLPDMLAQNTILENDHEKISAAYIPDLKQREVIQELPKEISPSTISKVQLFTGTFGQTLTATDISLQIIERETGTMLAETVVSNEQIMENTYTDFIFDDVQLKDGCSYQFEINVTAAAEDENVTIYYYGEDDWIMQENIDGFTLSIGEEQMQSSLIMRIMGTPGTGE